MTRFLLDTNVTGDITEHVPSEAVVAWMARQEDEDPFIAPLTVAEIRRGILELSAGKRRSGQGRWFAGPEGPRTLFAGRVLPFDEPAALAWARLMAEAKAEGRPRSALGAIVAAVAEANSCVVVTGDEKDFAGVALVNPFRGEAR